MPKRPRPTTEDFNETTRQLLALIEWAEKFGFHLLTHELHRVRELVLLMALDAYHGRKVRPSHKG